MSERGVVKVDAWKKAWLASAVAMLLLLLYAVGSLVVYDIRYPKASHAECDADGGVYYSKGLFAAMVCERDGVVLWANGRRP